MDPTRAREILQASLAFFSRLVLPVPLFFTCEEIYPKQFTPAAMYIINAYAQWHRRVRGVGPPLSPPWFPQLWLLWRETQRPALPGSDGS